MAQDFRARQIQTTQIIASGSSTTNAKIIFYDISAQSLASPNQGVIDSDAFGTGSIGTDIFFYVSGGIGEKDSGVANSISVFGGDLHVSGNFTVDGTGGGGSSVWIDSNNKLRTTASVAIDGEAGFVDSVGADVFFYVSGTINSWTTASLFGPKAISVFGGDLRVSGSFIGGNESFIEDDFPLLSSAPYNFIGGGTGHTISSFQVFTNNVITTQRNFIGAGLYNGITTAEDSVIVGGNDNSIISPAGESVTHGAFIGAGELNVVYASASAQVAGYGNEIEGLRSFGGAGTSNIIGEANNAFLGAGDLNWIQNAAERSFIGAGQENEIRSGYTDSFIGAGQRNFVAGDLSAVVAGADNGFLGGAVASFIGAGTNNLIDNISNISSWQSILVGSGNLIDTAFESITDYSVILGGQSNYITSGSSLLYGFDLTASSDTGNTIQFGSRIANKKPFRFVVSASRGAVFHGGLSGSLTTLADGSPYLLAGTNITLATGSSGAVTITSAGGGLATRQAIGFYAITTSTSSNPQSVGQGQFRPSEHNSSTCLLRSTLSVTNGSNEAFVQLFNVTSGTLVHVGGVGITELSTQNTTPTTVESVDLFSAINFGSSNAIYEVRAYSASSSLNIIHGSTELVCS